ncbi:MAG TPA: DUF4177 domain-containing protein [Acidimicrobiales bacterium]
MAEHKVIEVRATGRQPDVVAADIQSTLDAYDAEGWELATIQPVIYNSSTTGYFLLIFARNR